MEGKLDQELRFFHLLQLPLPSDKQFQVNPLLLAWVKYRHSFVNVIIVIIIIIARYYSFMLFEPP